MTQPIVRDAIYRHRRCPREVMKTAVGHYTTYRLTYRIQWLVMAERGDQGSPTRPSIHGNPQRVFFLRDLKRYILSLASLPRALFDGTVMEGACGPCGRCRAAELHK